MTAAYDAARQHLRTKRPALTADQHQGAKAKLKRFFDHFTGSTKAAREPDFYEGKNYLDAYIANTNWRVARNPQEAIGGMWDEIGSLQFDFLRRQGLAPHHRMLDLGCGTLRGGRHFIPFLDASNYWGIDIAPACIDAARDLVAAEGLQEKNPTLILNESKNLKFLEFGETKFDYILAQSVFTHLPNYMVRECFEHIGKVMRDEAKFFFTYWRRERSEQIGVKNFGYPWIHFLKLAGECGFTAHELSNAYPHPRNQKMGCINKPRANFVAH